MNLRVQLTILMVAIFAALLLVAVLAVDTARRGAETLRQVVETDMAAALALSEIDVALRDIQGRLMGTVLDHYPPYGSRLKLEADRARLRTAWARFRQAPVPERDGSQGDYPEPDSSELIRGIETYLPTLESLFDDMAAAYAREDRHRLQVLLDERWIGVYIELTKPINLLLPRYRLRAEQAYQARLRAADRLRGQVIVSMFVFGLLLLALMVWMVWRVTRGMARIKQGLTSIAQTPPDRPPAPVSEHGADEFAEMAASLNAMARRLHESRLELVTLQRRTELILNAMGEGLYSTDREGIITAVNPAGAAMLGWSVADLIGRPAHATLHHRKPDGSHYPRSECPMYATYRDGLVHRSEDEVFWRKDGTSLEIRLSSVPILDHGRVDGAVVVFGDVAARKAAERTMQATLAELRDANRRLEEAQGQLLQSEKMASIGQLAAGVAHEINNPIGFVSSNLNALQRYSQQLLELIDAYRGAEAAVADPSVRAALVAARTDIDLDFLREDLHSLIAESDDGLRRVRQIVLDLKNFSRVDQAEWAMADLNAGLESTLNVVWNEVKYKANVDKQLAPLPAVECIAAQINQVFMNLIVNAVQAIDTQGTIRLASGATDTTVWVTVADTGCGMSDEVKRRIFEPFFTTKSLGKGTGLGLSIAFGIVQKHHGSIDVESAPNQGTTFRVTLPIHQPEAPRSVPTAASDTP